MASSLININEATKAQLQTLKGIGPKRADNIAEFREQVAPIRNTLDLCAATGLSVKAAEAIARDIEWSSANPDQISALPAAFATIICISLIYIGFDEITQEPFVAPASFYHLSLALVLLGGLATAGDIIIASVRDIPSETTWIFPLSVYMIAAGLAILTVMGAAAFLIDLPGELANTIFRSLAFLIYATTMIWLLYGPTVLARRHPENLSLLAQWARIYDLGLPVLLSANVLLLTVFNDATWIDEIFTLWCLVICGINGVELKQGGSAFFSMLPRDDQSRVRFSIARSQNTEQSHLNASVSTQKTIAAAGIAVIGVVVISLLAVTA